MAFHTKTFFFSLGARRFPGRTLRWAKRFSFQSSGRRGPYEGLFDGDPAPPSPQIQNFIAPPSAQGDPNEASVFNDSDWAEEILPRQESGDGRKRS